MTDFYDALAPFYHLLFQDWEASIERQGAQLADLIRSRWSGEKVLDVSCGIGTQSFGLAENGFHVTASDPSRGAVTRARAEAHKRGLTVAFDVLDMRAAHERHGGGFDCVISCDNSIPHLLDDAEILRALSQVLLCLRPGGGCLLSVRDYAKEERGRNLVKTYGARIENSKRYLPFQVWDFEGDHYDFTLYLVEDDLETHAVTTRSMRSRYYAIRTDALIELVRRAGFVEVSRLDGVFYQPCIVGTRPRA